jgi:hypothetical protein
MMAVIKGAILIAIIREISPQRIARKISFLSYLKPATIHDVE